MKTNVLVVGCDPAGVRSLVLMRVLQDTGWLEVITVDELLKQDVTKLAFDELQPAKAPSSNEPYWRRFERKPKRR